MKESSSCILYFFIKSTFTTFKPLKQVGIFYLNLVGIPSNGKLSINNRECSFLLINGQDPLGMMEIFC